ncbi:hypothetical protein Bca4012_019796 [Brassica carinata]
MNGTRVELSEREIDGSGDGVLESEKLNGEESIYIKHGSWAKKSEGSVSHDAKRIVSLRTARIMLESTSLFKHDGEMYDEFGDLKKKYHVKTNQTVTTLAVAGGRALLEVEHRMLTSFFVYVHVRTFTDDNVQNASALESVILTSYGDASEPNLIEGIIPRHDP